MFLESVGCPRFGFARGFPLFASNILSLSLFRRESQIFFTLFLLFQGFFQRELNKKIPKNAPCETFFSFCIYVDNRSCLQCSHILSRFTVKSSSSHENTSLIYIFRPYIDKLLYTFPEMWLQNSFCHC